MPSPRASPRVWLFAGALALVGTGLLATRGGGDGRAGDAAAEAAPAIARACPMLRDVPAPPSAPLEAPADAGVCAVAETARAALARAELGDAELEGLRSSVAKALAEQPAACAPALARELEGATDCGLAYDAVAIRLLTAPTADPNASARVLSRPSKCQWKLVAALREVERVDVPIAAAVVRLTASPADEVRGTSWLALGTLERIARDAKQTALAACIDPLIASELAGATGDARATLVSAAGNAGCEGCRATIAEIIATSPDVRLRRSAVTALRFSSRPEDTETLCSVLRKDAEPATRAAAAFALRFGRVLPDARAKCLYEAAAEDDADNVRHDAIATLVELAEKDELFVGVLVQVMTRARAEPARREAAEALRAFATDDAIDDALRGARDD